MHVMEFGRPQSLFLILLPVVLARDETSSHVEMSTSDRNECCGLEATGNGKQVCFDFCCRSSVFSFKM